jgi:hypothetical protein
MPEIYPERDDFPQGDDQIGTDQENQRTDEEVQKFIFYQNGAQKCVSLIKNFQNN